MSEQANKALVRRLWHEYYNKKNDAVVDEIIGPDYVLWVSEVGWSELKSRGPACVRGFMKYWWGGFPDIQFTIEDMIAEGDKVLTVAACRGTQQGDFVGVKATGKPATIVTMVLSRISGGKIVEEWESFNWRALTRQLEATPK